MARASGNERLYIWLDTYIGVAGEYKKFKQQFQSGLRPVTAMPPRNINELICYIEENVGPIKFVPNIEDALALIQSEVDTNIILISSGTLGQEIIPSIISNYPRVSFFYIFCGYIQGLIDWALEHGYECCTKMFDFETDLLIHLARDASEDFIKIGKTYMQLHDGENARKYFVTAQTLETSANEIDQLHPPLLLRLRSLEGENGLIAQARNLMNN